MIMTEQQNIDYNRITAAIEYITQNFKQQPTLDEVAEHVHLSPFHFQKMFKEWAGTTPKKFLQYTSVEYAKKLLKENRATLFDAAYETGLSGTGRLHDLFINIEGMTPAEYKNGGKSLNINYSFSQTPFGKIIIASTAKGICYMAFEEDEIFAVEKMRAKFPNAAFVYQTDTLQKNALSIFRNDWSRLTQIKLHLKGTDFQLKVWETLLKIPMGAVSTYGTVAHKIESQPLRGLWVRQ
jgi:AraC family transcriptional regulator of adaptative response/methylated-DNA-[protein]-cysteine methyltransferase